MRNAVFGVSIALGLAVARVASADEVPPPRFDRVDHAKPEKCLALDPKAGSERAIRAIAAGLKNKTPEDTLAAVDRWMARTLEWDSESFDEWRPIDRMVADGTYGGCADHAMVYGTLLRACGIPTIWVKTMDLSWIEKFRSGAFDPNRESWSGHVLLEVHLAGAWRLLDAQGRRLYWRYDPAARLFPDGRFAYDKGSVPWDLILSVRWEDWKKQTSAYFRSADPAGLLATDERAAPLWGDARPVGRAVYVAGNSPRYVWAERALRSSGWSVARSFNTDFEKILGEAKGQVVLVTCSQGEPVLPRDLRQSCLPVGWEKAVADSDAGRGWSERTLTDGTRVVLVTSRSRHGIARAVSEALGE